MSEKQHTYDLPEESGGIPRELFLECIDGLLTVGEAEALLLSFAAGRGDEGFTEDEVEEVLSLARAALFESEMIRLAARGLATVDLEEGGLTFSLTDEALARAEDLAREWKARRR